MLVRNSLFVSLLGIGLWAAPLAAQQGMIHTLVSSYTPGEQQSLELTPDGSRGFLALGATIDVLDMTGLQPVEIAKHPMPDCQPLAMRYFHLASPDTHYLYIAGGALGVWRITLCPSIFQAVNPVGCGHTSFADLIVQDRVEFGYFERKRCVDVEILPNASPPVLFALFGSSSEHSTQQEVTELRAYDISTTTPSLMTTCYFDTTNPQATPQEYMQVGTALAADPADDDSVYVAMGKGGIWRADLTGSSGNWNLQKYSVWTPGSCGSQPTPEHVRDLSIVRVQTSTPQSVLYAALNYGEILEISNLGQSSVGVTFLL